MSEWERNLTKKCEARNNKKKIERSKESCKQKKKKIENMVKKKKPKVVLWINEKRNVVVLKMSKNNTFFIIKRYQCNLNWAENTNFSKGQTIANSFLN